MYRRIMDVALAVTMLVGLLTVGWPVLADSIRIVAYGGSSTCGNHVKRVETYPAQVEKMLKDQEYDVAALNAGENGRISYKEIRRSDLEIPVGTQIVVAELGVNDSYAHVAVSETHANLDKLVAHLRERNIQVLLLSYLGSHRLDKIDDKFKLSTNQSRQVFSIVSL